MEDSGKRKKTMMRMGVCASVVLSSFDGYHIPFSSHVGRCVFRQQVDEGGKCGGRAREEMGES